MAVTAMAMIAISFERTATITRKQNKDERYPSLNVIQPRSKERTGKPSTDQPPDAEAIKLVESAAFRRAFEIHKEANSLEGSYIENAADFC